MPNPILSAFGITAPKRAPSRLQLMLTPTATPQEAYWASKLANQGTVKAHKPTVSERVEGGMAKSLGALFGGSYGRHVANRAVGALNDATPLGNVTGIGEGQDMFASGVRRGDLAKGALGLGMIGLNMLPFAGGGLKRKAGRTLSDILSNEEGAIRAWHGSPHDFDRFSLDKIGTGEGAQAYGHGLYFAENKKVAEDYRDTLKHKAIDRSFIAREAGVPLTEEQQGIVWRNLMEGVDPVQGALKVQSQFRELRDEGAPLFPYAPVPGSKGAALIDLHKRGLPKADGRLYEVNINAEPGDFLDWDAPLREQSKGVQDIFAANFDRKQALADYAHHGPDKAERLVDMIWSDPSGNNIYRNLPVAGVSDSFKQTDAARAEMMRRLGLPGIRYLDQGSRGAGNGTHNYVVFDDKLIDILNKY